MNQAQHVLTLFGSYAINKAPQRLPYPFLITAKSTLNVQLQNIGATDQTRTDVAMIGFKVFYTGGNRRDVFHVL
jgi:hypothetical protein